MYLDMVTPLEHIEEYIKQLVLQEVTLDGLLKDVKSTKTTFKDLTIHETPSVWIYLGEWHIEEENTNKNNSRVNLVYDVEISVITNKPDIKDSDRQATSIQARIVESVAKNWKRVINKNMNIQNPGFNIITGYGDGRLTVANKNQRVVIKGVTIQFKFLLDWMRCLTTQYVPVNNNDNEETDNNNNDNGG